MVSSETLNSLNSLIKNLLLKAKYFTSPLDKRLFLYYICTENSKIEYRNSIFITLKIYFL